MLGNKEAMAENIKRYMEISGKSASTICADLGFKQNTFSDWIHARTYPRIDKIELMANYFHVPKSMLVEEYSPKLMEAAEEKVLLDRFAELPKEIKIAALSYADGLLNIASR